jgi:hypothetical protein
MILQEQRNPSAVGYIVVAAGLDYQPTVVTRDITVVWL